MLLILNSVLYIINDAISKLSLKQLQCQIFMQSTVLGFMTLTILRAIQKKHEALH
ncbi:hypothetical protein OTSTA716_0757 [Orientia tsutsugamushi str. TA716]|uniref:Uncharacterized protein n=1 Tax=Orientia tsutsugamushi str. TA716 TaxID=1359175 RepID=A0A0F3P820_ORITS|nr:hypothetical protein OTSTA716_0757 [Orientia tsutsugamushi str. TA716]